MCNLILTISDIPPSNNKFLGNSNSYHIYSKYKQDWHTLIKKAINNKPKKPIKTAIVKITYYFKDKRRRDPDNYSGKMILDPLVKEGILEDDSFSHITLILCAGYDKNNPRTVIEIKEDVND